MTRLLGVALLLAACSPKPHDRVAPASSSAAPAASAAPLRASPRRADPRWLAARDEDPLAKARLAEQVGAAGLLDGVEDGGEVAETALAALPFADDGEVALGRLGELASSEAGARARILGAILGVAGQPRRQREALDPEGARRCGEAVLRLASDKALPREERALAVSAARALAEKGWVDPAKVPGDLDPKER